VQRRLLGQKPGGNRILAGARLFGEQPRLPVIAEQASCQEERRPRKRQVLRFQSARENPESGSVLIPAFFSHHYRLANRVARTWFCSKPPRRQDRKGGPSVERAKPSSLPPLPRFDRLCYNGAAVERVAKSINACEVNEEWALQENSVAEQSRSNPSRFEAVSAGNARPEDASRYCPVCSQRLESRRCKLICNVCGYYMSCADYY